MGLETSTNWLSAFNDYFNRPVAIKAAAPLSDGVVIELRLTDTGEQFFFTKISGKNQIQAGAPATREIVFKMRTTAAAGLLADPSDDVATIALNIARRIFNPDPSEKVEIEIHTGFFGLFTKGYFGVLASGGSAFATLLAQKGLGSISAIKAALKKASVKN